MRENLLPMLRLAFRHSCCSLCRLKTYKSVRKFGVLKRKGKDNDGERMILNYLQRNVTEGCKHHPLL